ncbi:MAG: hypothetical protein KME46_08630 [Brasilonema angustatum HA4187-MV1]|jgi:hypothetical protein|nr:hypothetical protein [Brasilonema angustatum HA4187-MV1]
MLLIKITGVAQVTQYLPFISTKVLRRSSGKPRQVLQRDATCYKSAQPPNAVAREPPFGEDLRSRCANTSRLCRESRHSRWIHRNALAHHSQQDPKNRVSEPEIKVYLTSCTSCVIAIFVRWALPIVRSKPYFYVVGSAHPTVIENGARSQF